MTNNITATASTLSTLASNANAMEQAIYNLQALLDDTRTALETGDAYRAQRNAEDIAARAARLAATAGEHGTKAHMLTTLAGVDKTLVQRAATGDQNAAIDYYNTNA